MEPSDREHSKLEKSIFPMHCRLVVSDISIRFYLDGDNTNAISGMNCASTFGRTVEKQLVMRFKDIRETFFSHAVVIVEGETEYGAMPYFAEKLGIPLDEKMYKRSDGQR